MNKRIFLTLLGIAGCCTAGFAAPHLRLSGTLAQSAEDSIKFKTIGSAGITNDPATGNLIVLNEGNLYQRDNNGVWSAILKNVSAPGTLENDGKDIFIKSNQAVTRIGKENGEWKRLHQFFLEKPYKHLTIADAKTTAGFAAKGKIFGLDGLDVYAFDPEGKKLGKVLTLPELLDKCPYTTLAVLPGSGDLLVASYYPDLKFYRFKTDGTEYKKDGWPIGGWVTGTVFCEGRIWGFHSMATGYSDSVVKRNELPEVGKNDLYLSGIASDGKSGYYLNTSQGIKHYPAGSFKEAAKRIGGSGNVKALALYDSRIIASLGNQLYGLKLDDMYDSPFFSQGNEPWRVGNGWSGETGLIVPFGKKFLVYDNKGKTLWQFDPAAEGGDRWIRQPEKFNDLRDMAVRDNKKFFLDGGKYAGISGLNRLDAVNADTVVAADKNTVYRISGGKTDWKTAIGGEINDIAVIGDYAAVAAGDTLFLLSLKNGKIVSRTPAKLMQLAADGKWLVGYEPEKAALLRFKLAE